MSTDIQDQPPPSPGVGDVWADLIECMRQRRQLGIDRYGTPLQTGNGRDALADAAQELLDLWVYLHQHRLEREQLRAENARLRADLLSAGDRIATMAQHLSRLAEKGVTLPTEELRKEDARLRAALEPFAVYAKAVTGNWPDNTICALCFVQPDGDLDQKPCVNLGHCRQARAALEQQGGGT